MVWSHSLWVPNRHNLCFLWPAELILEMGPHAPIDYPSIFWAKPSIWSALYSKDFLDKNDIRFLPTPGASYQDSSFTFGETGVPSVCLLSGRASPLPTTRTSVNSKGKVY